MAALRPDDNHERRQAAEPVNLAGVSRDALRALIDRERIHGRAFSAQAEAARHELAKQTGRP